MQTELAMLRAEVRALADNLKDAENRAGLQVSLCEHTPLAAQLVLPDVQLQLSHPCHLLPKPFTQCMLRSVFSEPMLWLRCTANCRYSPYSAVQVHSRPYGSGPDEAVSQRLAQAETAAAEAQRALHVANTTAAEAARSASPPQRHASAAQLSFIQSSD